MEITRKLISNHFKLKQILCFGEILWDRLPSGSKPGGAPMNVALHLKRLGENPLFASSVGNDEAGDELISFLEKNNMQPHLIQKDKNLPTSEVLVTLDADGNPAYEICIPVAWDNILPETELISTAKKSRIIVFGTLASRSETTRKTLLNLLDSDTYKILDVNFRPPFDDRQITEKLMIRSNFVKLNQQELNIISQWLNLEEVDEKTAMQAVAAHYNLDGICTTRGSNGASLLLNDNWIENRGFKVKVADTVGAGDSFLAALITGFVQNQEPTEALKLACATGAFVASKEGATPEYTLNDILSITV